MGRFQSGQMGQTVNLLAFAFGGSIPPRPTILKRPGLMNGRVVLNFMIIDEKKLGITAIKIFAIEFTALTTIIILLNIIP